MNMQPIFEYLQEEGYRPILDEDGDIKFKSSGKTYWLNSPQTDDMYLRMFAAGNIWPMKTREEWQLALQITDQISRDFKGVKAYTVSQDDVFFSVDLFLSEPAMFSKFLPRCLSALDTAVIEFLREINSLSESTNKAVD